MKIASAKLTPYSSVVGQSIELLDEKGKHVCQLAIVGAGSQKIAALVGQQIVDLFEDLDRHKAVVENLHILSTSNK